MWDMELKCPNCGEFIPAENINIQEMVALCGKCQHVFAFTRKAIARKTKRRIPPQPERVQVHIDDDGLELSYRLVFGSGSKFGLVMATLAATGSTLLLVNASLSHEPTSLLFFFALIALVFSYVAAVGVTTTTTITADTQHLEVSSGPLPFPIKDDKTLNTADITRVSFEETYESNSPLPPSYNVYAELQDGARISVVTSLPRTHAQYIAATLDDYLHDDVDVGIMEGGDDVFDGVEQPDALANEAANHRQHRLN
jgi:DNA-directed RNA polymerase subunit M/transcription elongation factor TFIIS